MRHVDLNIIFTFSRFLKTDTYLINFHLMESTIPNALQLLAIGMITVFMILALVVISGNVLIKIVNKYAPEPTKRLTRSSRTATGTSPEVIAAITAVVETVTAGNGRVDSIEKVD